MAAVPTAHDAVGNECSVPPLPPVRGLWVGSGLTPIERLSIRSFLAHGHPYELFTYDRIAGVPDGTTLADANELIPRDHVFLSHGSPAHFADWFRWKLMVERGGYWADLDVVCLERFDFSEPLVFGWQDDHLINTAVLGFPAGHSLACTMLRRCESARPVWPGKPGPPLGNPREQEASDSLDWSAQPWGLVGGPYGFTLEVRRAGLVAMARPAQCFYPVSYTSWRRLLEPDSRALDDALAGAWAVHLWNDMFERHGVDKHAAFPPSSFIGQLEARYL